MEIFQICLDCEVTQSKTNFGNFENPFHENLGTQIIGLLKLCWIHSILDIDWTKHDTRGRKNVCIDFITCLKNLPIHV